jgi:hypothetical protein
VLGGVGVNGAASLKLQCVAEFCWCCKFLAHGDGGGSSNRGRGGWDTVALGLETRVAVEKIQGPFGLRLLKFNSHHINVPSNVWSIKCRLIAYMSAQIRSNLRDESIKPN